MERNENLSSLRVWQNWFLILATVQVVGPARPSASSASSGFHAESLRPHLPSLKSGADLDCPTCVNFTEQAIVDLMNISMREVVNSCDYLCGVLAQKTGSAVLGEICDELCFYVGVDGFLKLMTKADLNPIYFCELINICPVFDHGDAIITDLTVDPATGHQGIRTVSFTILSKNGTGTGELNLVVKTVDRIEVDDWMLRLPKNSSAYPEPQSFKLMAKPNPNCDPARQACEKWLPGNYVLTVEICNGECGSRHPHSRLYDQKQVNFTIIG